MWSSGLVVDWELCNRTDRALRFVTSEFTEMVAAGANHEQTRVKTWRLIRRFKIMDKSSCIFYDVKLPWKWWRPLWRELKAKSDIDPNPPFRVYITSVNRSFRRLLIVPNRSMASFLRDIPDSTHLSDIMLPGTHGSVAFYGWPFAACQSSSQPLSSQLRNGIRVIDIRLSVVRDKLIAYHAFIPERTTFEDILSTLYEFLRSEEGQSETIVMSIKQEDFASSSPELFSKLVHDAIYLDTTCKGEDPRGSAPTLSSADMWFLERRVPTLGEVRGKIILFSRFGNGAGWDRGLEGMGIHPTLWPDSLKGEWLWDCRDTTFQSQDWYDVGCFTRAAEKFELTARALITSSGDGSPRSSPVLPLSFSSASSIPFALPSMIALGVGVGEVGYIGVNRRLGRWFLDILGTADEAVQQGVIASVCRNCKTTTQKSTEKSSLKIRGWLLMDFFEEPAGLVPLIVEMNFLGSSAAVLPEPKE